MSIEKDFSESSYLRAKRSPLYRAYLDEKYAHKYSEIAQDFFGKEPLAEKPSLPSWGEPGFDDLPIGEKIIGYQNRFLEDNDFLKNTVPGYEKVLDSEKEAVKFLNVLASLDISSFSGKVFLEENDAFTIYNMAVRPALYRTALSRNYTNLPTDTWHFIFSKSKNTKDSNLSRKDMLLYDNDSPTYKKFKKEIFEKYRLENSTDILCMNLDIDLRGIHNQDTLYGVRSLTTGPESISDVNSYIKDWALYQTTNSSEVYDRLYKSLGESPLMAIVMLVDKANVISQFDEFMCQIFDGIVASSPEKMSKSSQEMFLDDFINFCTFLELNEHKLSNSITVDNFIEEGVTSKFIDLLENNVEVFLLDCACYDQNSFSSKLEILREVFKGVQSHHEKLNFVKSAMSDMALDNSVFKKIMEFPGLAKFVELKRPLDFEKLYGVYLDREKDQGNINLEVLGIALKSIPSENLARLINYCANHEDDLLDMSKDDLKYLSGSYEAERNLELIFTPKVLKKYTNLLKEQLLNGMEFSWLEQINSGCVQVSGKFWENKTNEMLPYLNGQKNLLHEKMLSSDNDTAVFFAKRMGVNNLQTANAIIKNGALKIKREKLFNETLKLGLTVSERDNRLDFSIHNAMFLENQLSSLVENVVFKRALFNAHRLNITNENLFGEEYEEIKNLLGVKYSGFLNPKIVSLWGFRDFQHSSGPSWKELEKERESLGEYVYSVAYFIKLAKMAAFIPEEDVQKLDKSVIKKGLENLLNLQEAEVFYGVKSFADTEQKQGSLDVLEIVSSVITKKDKLMDEANLWDYESIIDDFNKRNPVIARQVPIFSQDDNIKELVVKTAVMLSANLGTQECRKVFLGSVAEKSPEALEKLKKYVPSTNVYFENYVNVLAFNKSLQVKIVSKIDKKDSTSMPVDRSFKL